MTTPANVDQVNSERTSGAARLDAWLIAILLLALLVRSIGLFNSPPGPNQDEISNALDAMCLIETGSDRYSRPLPIYLRGFDDYREGLFVYLSLPIALLVDEWRALRIAAVAIGCATVLVAYFIARGLFGIRAGRWSALFLAIDPQHVLWSRLGMEVVLVPLGVALAWLAYIACERGWRLGVWLLAMAMLLTIYSGMMGKPAAVVLAVALLTRPMLWWRILRSQTATCVLAISISGVLLIPAFQSALSDEGRARFDQIRVLASDRMNFASEVAGNWLTYWSPRYLLTRHAEGQPRWPTVGNMGYAPWLCLMIGIACLLIRPAGKHTLPLLALVLLAVLPAALTNTIAPSRVLFAIPVLAAISGRGAQLIVEYLGVRRGAPILLGGASITLAMLVMDMSSSLKVLDQFFRGDQRRVTGELVETASKAKFIDATIPFALEYAAFESGASVGEIQTAFFGPGPGPIYGEVGGIIVAHPALMANAAPNTTWMTWKERPVPGMQVIHSDGDYKLVKRLPQEDRPTA